MKTKRGGEPNEPQPIRVSFSAKTSRCRNREGGNTLEAGQSQKHTSRQAEHSNNRSSNLNQDWNNNIKCKKRFRTNTLFCIIIILSLNNHKLERFAHAQTELKHGLTGRHASRTQCRCSLTSPDREPPSHSTPPHSTPLH